MGIAFSKSIMNKEAIMFILDANVTMNAPYPLSSGGYWTSSLSSSLSSSSSSSSTTRLDQARDAVLDTIVDRMWKSKQNDAGVVILRTGMTHHHLSELEKIVDPDIDLGRYFRKCGRGVKLGRYIPMYDGVGEEDDIIYPNLVEFELNRPSPSTLRLIRSVQCTISEAMASSNSIRGDLCDGLILAADALHRRTNGKKYRRKIVMITDAEHVVDVNLEQLHFVLGELGKMEVELIVLGIEFEEGCASMPIKNEDLDTSRPDDDYVKPEAVTSMDHRKPEVILSMEADNDNSMLMVKEEGNPDEFIDDIKDERSIQVEFIKRENEKLLRSIAREVGGVILAANGTNLTDLLRTKLPNVSGLINSMGKKMEFRIAPDLTLMVKTSKLTAQQNLPTTVKEAYQFDPDTGKKVVDGNGELMTLPTRTQTNHYDDDGNFVPYDKRTDAFRYGSDLIPVGKMDLLGINAAFADPGSIEMMGFINQTVVKESNLLMGPAYAITGGESMKSRTAIAALAMALVETRMVGFCRVVRTRNGEPKIGVLVPKLVECDSDNGGAGVKGAYLAFLELPFADDLQRHIIRRIPSEYQGDYEDECVCDDLIDSMMLPHNFMSNQIPFPALSAYRRMIAHFAMKPLDANEEMNAKRILEASRARPLCDFDVVKSVNKRASSHINAFVGAFPLVEHKAEDDKKLKFWGDGATN